MGNFYIPPVRSDEIYHWGIEKGKEKTNHKYYNRLLLGAKNGKNLYRYFYDKAAWDAYNNGKKEVKKVVNQTSKSVSNLIANSPAKSLVESGKNLFNNLFKTREEKDEYKAWKENAEKERKENAAALTKREEAIEAAREKRLNNIIETEPKGERKYKYLARIKNPNAKGYLYFYSEEKYRKWLEGHGGDEEELAKTFGLKKNKMTEEEDMAEVNEKGNRNTCWSCSLSYELRRRGYDVEAIDTNQGEYANVYLEAFKEFEDDVYYLKKTREAKDIACESTKEFNMQGDKDTASKIFADENNRAKMAENYIKAMERSYPEGSRGIFTINWYGGGGHAVNWEIKDGKLMIRECQKNYTATGKDAVKYLQRCGGEYNYNLQDYGLACSAYRTDNLTINEDIIKTNPDGTGKNRHRTMVNKN